MFDNLTARLQGVFSKLTGRGRLSEADVDAAMREIRMALLEADVSLAVVRGFVARVQTKAGGLERIQAVAPANQFVKVVHDEMDALPGGQPPRHPSNRRGVTPTFTKVALEPSSGKRARARRIGA